jgi:tetratricopeptide (TPR) repeat protein
MVVGRDKPAEAVSYLERAAELAPEAMPVYADLDRAYQRAGQTAKRVSMLERAAARLPQRHELAHQLALAYFDAGRYDDAVKVYLSRQFRVAEGEYQLHDDYAAALMARAMTHLAAGRNRQALADLDAAMDYPENLGIGRPDRAGADATIHYWRGVALNSLGQAAEAKKEWSQAAEGGRLSRRMSPWSAERGLHAVHAIMALRRLGEAARAEELASGLEQACSRFEDYYPPHGKAFVTMMRGLLAAADGRLKEAGTMLEQADVGSEWVAGYLRLAREWVKLLERFPAMPPAPPQPRPAPAP